MRRRGIDWSWTERAACAGMDTARFYPPQGTNPPKAVLAVCEGCPVRLPCLEYAVSRPDEDGIWGGTTFLKRREMRMESLEATG